ncbi:MAG: hypothetical protein KKC79_02315 [Gammaproteobacteria bacterium]|nr:hypothetical protein [Gammaproteobacteria bacterium]MBU1441451.1 hypothetical protein [Gammaproteobacteria bacterium]MBU2285559.1 hypothetical protein [Gammaproteobacteria bacterium]MBU2407465.1 hypothetical protein [Gammaproteobacteria bacterium]
MTLDANNLKSRSEYQADRSAIFPSTTSLDWFIRRHRARLASAGALAVICGRLLIHQEIFDKSVMEIGRRLAGLAAEASPPEAGEVEVA